MVKMAVQTHDSFTMLHPFFHRVGVKEGSALSVVITTLSLLLSPFHPCMCARRKKSPVCAHGEGVKEAMGPPRRRA